MPGDDWLDRICPYLLSRDGSYRSSQPDTEHRCTAQDPPSTLPLAFQERFCLSERHVRCEMFKVAQSARSAALGQEGIPADQVRTARFKPSVRSVPLALGPSSVARPARSGPPRPLILALLGVGGLAILVFVLAALLGGGGGGSGAPDASSSPALPAATSTVPPSAAVVTRAPATAATNTAQPASPATGAQATEPPPAGMRIQYEVQADEALIAIAESFGTSRREILAANPGMAEQRPYTQPGDVIIVPVAPEMSRADIEAVPGFIGYVE